MSTLLELRNLSHSESHQAILSDVNLLLNAGDILMIQGESGSGKSTLLRCIAHLLPYEGQIFHNGSSLDTSNIPRFRNAVMYLPQRASILPGTPCDFLQTVCSFKSRKTDKGGKKTEGSFLDWNQARVLDIASSWGIDENVWNRSWTSLSGGEAQRVALATAIGLDTAEVLLLDGALSLH
jgi:ABC-type iron transport system FetAB ATPase subunit